MDSLKRRQNHFEITEKMTGPLILAVTSSTPLPKFKVAFSFPKSIDTGCPKKIVPRLYGYCGGAADSIISVFAFAQLHR